MTMPNPNIIDIIDEPPYDIIGRGAPTIGNKPNTIAIFTKTYKNNAVEKPKQNNLEKKLLQENPILIIL